MITILPTSPSAKRLLARLQDHGPAHRRALAKACFLEPRTTARYLQEYRQAGVIHVAGWVRLNPAGNGPWSPVYAYGSGEDQPKPALITHKQKHLNHKRRLESKLGSSLAKRVLASLKTGGAQTLVIDGRTVYRRGVGVLV